MDVDGIALRACGLEDAEALALVGGATFLESFAGLLDGRAIVAHCRRHHTVEAYAKYLTKEGTEAWLAETVKRCGPVGYVMLTAPELTLQHLDDRDWELKRIYLLYGFMAAGRVRH